MPTKQLGTGCADDSLQVIARSILSLSNAWRICNIKNRPPEILPLAERSCEQPGLASVLGRFLRHFACSSLCKHLSRVCCRLARRFSSQASHPSSTGCQGRSVKQLATAKLCAPQITESVVAAQLFQSKTRRLSATSHAQARKHSAEDASPLAQLRRRSAAVQPAAEEEG